MALFHSHNSHRDGTTLKGYLAQVHVFSKFLTWLCWAPKSTPSRSSLWAVIFSSSAGKGKIIKEKWYMSLWLSPSLLRPLPNISSPFPPSLSDGLLWMIRAGNLAVYSGSSLVLPFLGALIFLNVSVYQNHLEWLLKKFRMRITFGEELHRGDEIQKKN